jgi:hypothetical protein
VVRSDTCVREGIDNLVYCLGQHRMREFKL